jgi:hypothetical protein
MDSFVLFFCHFDWNKVEWRNRFVDVTANDETTEGSLHFVPSSHFGRDDKKHDEVTNATVEMTRKKTTFNSTSIAWKNKSVAGDTSDA